MRISDIHLYKFHQTHLYMEYNFSVLFCFVSVFFFFLFPLCETICGGSQLDYVQVVSGGLLLVKQVKVQREVG